MFVALKESLSIRFIDEVSNNSDLLPRAGLDPSGHVKLETVMRYGMRFQIRNYAYLTLSIHVCVACFVRFGDCLRSEQATFLKSSHQIMIMLCKACGD